MQLQYSMSVTVWRLMHNCTYTFYGDLSIYSCRNVSTSFKVEGGARARVYLARYKGCVSCVGGGGGEGKYVN